MITTEQMHPGFTKFHLNRGGEEPWPFRPVLHRFIEPDRGDPHDHPFAFTTHILRGSYYEAVYSLQDDGSWVMQTHHRQAGTAHHVAADCIHRIVALPEGECWTLVLPGAWEREPRFWRFEDGRAVSRVWNEEYVT